MSVFRPLGVRFEPSLVLVVREEPRLLELLRTLVVGLGGVALDTELERRFVPLSQSSHSHAFDSRRSIISFRVSDRCSASSLYSAWEHILWRDRL